MKDRRARWREAQRKTPGIKKAEESPALSEAEVLTMKCRRGRRGELFADSKKPKEFRTPDMSEFDR